MNISEANIEITRHGANLHSVAVAMPAWNKIGEDGAIAINMPLLGIKTFAKDDADVDVAIDEALKCFCIVTEKFGRGLDAELVAIGWTAVRNEKERAELDFNIPADNLVMQDLIETGEPCARALEFA